MHPVELVDARPHLADGLAELVAESQASGVRNVAALVDGWSDGTQRFDQPGEAVLAACVDGRIVGVGGLTRCPHVPGAMRVRRFYVLADCRRRGVATALAGALIEVGFRHADVITCNARASDAAAPFWERLGFTPTDTDGITHLRRRAGAQGAQ